MYIPTYIKSSHKSLHIVEESCLFLGLIKFPLINVPFITIMVASGRHFLTNIWSPQMVIDSNPELLASS